MLRVWFSAVVLLAVAPLSGAEKFSLSEDAGSTATWLVENRVTGEGEFEFQATGDATSPLTHPVTVNAEFRYAERRLPSAGRDEAAYRSLRDYHEAKSDIEVGSQLSSPRLRSERRRLVIRIEDSNLSPYSPNGPLTAKELELLPSLGDSLLVAALLPDHAVEVGEVWNPAPWVGPALAGAEVALDGKVTCRLEAVQSGEAIIRVDGTISGAAKGATTETTLEGTLRFDTEKSVIVAAELTQKEERSIGPLMPGMSLALTSTMKRSPAPSAVRFREADVTAIPETPPAEALQLEYHTAFGVALRCDRDWMPFHQTGELLVLRLLDRGGLIAQCNLTPAPQVKPGRRTSDREFQEDIARTLGEHLTKIVSAEEVHLGGDRAIYRVTAVGKVAEVDRIWRYYLITTTEGQQAALVFTTDPVGAERLGDRDLDLVKSLTFDGADTPTPAVKREQP